MKVVVAEETPLPLLAVRVTDLLPTEALLAAFRLMLPEFPVPGWVYVAVTPLGRLLFESVTLPAVKLVRVRVTLMLCALPPRMSVTEPGFTLTAILGAAFTVKVNQRDRRYPATAGGDGDGLVAYQGGVAGGLQADVRRSSPFLAGCM